MDAIQFELPYDQAQPPHAQAFEAWVHTPEGGQVANRFIRIAIGFLRRGQKIGAKAIAERLRWNAFVRKAEGEAWLINNNYVSYLARFAMERAPELQDFFETREVGRGKMVEETTITRRKYA